MSEIRTRFAPSPTGFLHIGGARTALFNYLQARRHGGSFVLRIEDTDRKRSSQEYVDAILEGLAWLGLDHDEGPFFQSRRAEVYERTVQRLKTADACYWCFCSPEELDARRAAAQAEGRRAMYDRSCRDIGREPGPGETPVLRFRAPLDGETVVDDLVRGQVRFDNRELDDLILLRSDGTATFHLVVVADDLDMRITHILRGEDHLTNTPRQVQIFRALGAEPPAYGHMPLIVGADRARLSKRHGATAVGAYKEQGFLADATVNYLARLGWAHGDQELFTRAELIEHFDIAGIGKAAGAFDMDKFTWVNTQHIKRSEPRVLADEVRPFLAEGDADEDYLAAAVALLRERAKTLVELAGSLGYFLAETPTYDPKAVAKVLDAEALALLEELAAALDGLEPWDDATIEGVFQALVEARGIKLGKLAQPVRVALTGGTQSPGIFELCRVLGRERTLSRVQRVIRDAPAGALPTA